jgi:hypothetical protein
LLLAQVALALVHLLWLKVLTDQIQRLLSLLPLAVVAVEQVALKA